MDNRDFIAELDQVKGPIQEVIGRVPHWTLKSGTTLIFIFFLLILLLSYFVQYPDVLIARVSIITDTPSQRVIAPKNGKLVDIRVAEGDLVIENQILGIFETPADYQDVFLLKNALRKHKLYSGSFNLSLHLELGSLKPSYLNFVDTYHKYHHYFNNNNIDDRLTKLDEQIKKYEQVINLKIKEESLVANELDIKQKQYAAKGELVKKNLLSETDLGQERLTVLNTQKAFENISSRIVDYQIAANNMELSRLELLNQKAEEEHIYQLKLKESYEDLLNQIHIWEQNNILRSEINGKVTFTSMVNKNQYLNQGEEVIVVVPAEAHGYWAYGSVPIWNSSKIKSGQKVNIKLDNYPHEQNGVVKGLVAGLSLVPNGDQYQVKIELPDDLKTSFGSDLVFYQEMQGNGEIVTEELRLIERLFFKLVSTL